MRKVIAVIFILLLLVGLAYAGDVKKEDKEVLKDSVIDKTKETLKEVEKGISVRDTSADIAKYDVFKEKDKITISKADTVKDKKVEHTKTKLVMDEKTAKSIDVDKDGKFSVLRKVDGQVVEDRVVTLKELTNGIDATFSEVIIDGFAGSYTKIGSSQTVSTNMSLGQSFNSTKTSAISLNISTTAYSDPYTEIAAMNPVAWYKLDNTSGTIAIDATANGHTGTVSGATWITGKYNNALSFDGVDDSLSVPASSQWNMSHFSIVANINGYYTPAAYHIIFDHYDPSAVKGGYGLFVYNKLITFRCGNGTVLSDAKSTMTLSNNAWYQVVATYDGTTMKLYINGVLHTTKKLKTIKYINKNLYVGAYGGSGSRFKGKIDNPIIIATALNQSQITTLYFDNLQQLQARTNANSTYSGYWNSTSNNPLTLPISSLDGLISSIQFKVPVNVTQNGINIYYFNQTVAPFTPTASVLFTDDITEITDSHTALVQTVNITHTSTNTAQDGELIPYDILDEYFGTIDFDTTNPNATITRNATHFMVDTGYITANTTYYYNVSIPNYVEEMVWSDWNPDNETCNAKLQIGNSTPYTTWNITTFNVTDGSLYKLVYASNGTEVGNATAANGSASIIILGLVDGVYWLTETPVLIGFINVPAVAVVIIGAAGAFVGGSFINKWYRRRRGS